MSMTIAGSQPSCRSALVPGAFIPSLATSAPSLEAEVAGPARVCPRVARAATTTIAMTPSAAAPPAPARAISRF